MSEAHPGSLDELFDALAAGQRRGLLRLLRERDGPATLSELARDLGSTATAADGGDRGSGARRTHVRLHHVHAPKLAAAGLVEFDHDRGSIELTSRFERAAAILDLATDLHRGEA